MKQKLLFGMSLFFGFFTCVGTSYVISTQGQAEPGYTYVPLMWQLLFAGLYQKEKLAQNN